jgi:hypothetical protein
MVRNFTARRAGGSETTKWSQPGSREAALRGLRGQRPLCGLNLGDASRHLGVPKESAVPPIYTLG